jgi:NAD-dependent SIR2 family protein deacetylase
MGNVLKSSTPNQGEIFTKVTERIKNGEIQNVIIMCGAGISTSAGIPDFRSPSTGLYFKLRKYNLPYPEAIFEYSYFKKDPKPFYALVKGFGDILLQISFGCKLVVKNGISYRLYDIVYYMI